MPITATEMRGRLVRADLTDLRAVTVVCAHPDDESFGLGAVITTLAEAGIRLRLVCFTAGENSTLGGGPDLAVRRARELDCAAQALGIEHVTLLGHPDGALDTVPPATLAADVVGSGPPPDALLTFDQGGITGHPDHDHATRAAIEAARHLGVPVWAWAIPTDVATALRTRFGAPFVGRDDDQLDLSITVDRSGQRRAIACHGSQLDDNPVPEARIHLQGPVETLRLLHDPTTRAHPATTQERTT